MVVLIILTPYRTPEISNTAYLLTVSSFIFLCFKMKIDFKIIEISKHRYIEIKMIINHKPNNHNEALTFLKTAKFNGIRRHNALQNKPHFHQNKSPQNFLLRSCENELKIYTRSCFYERLIKLVKRKLLIRNRVNDKTTLIDTSSIVWCNRQCHAKVIEQKTNATTLHHRQRSEDDWGGFNYFIFQVSPTSMLTAAQWRFSWWLRASCIHLTISSALRNVLLPRGDPSY